MPHKRRVFNQRCPMLSVVVPCYNEAEVLAHTHARLARTLDRLVGFEYEHIYVDDGSVDGTWQIVESLAEGSRTVRGVKLSRNFGHQAACLAGLRESAGDAVVVIDADLQDPPELIAEMVALWCEGWSVVSARRRSRAGESVFKRLSAFAYYRMLKALSEHDPALDTGDFRLLDREVVALLVELPEKDLYLRGAVSWFGLPETGVAYDRDPRLAGESKYDLRRMLGLARSGLLVGSAAPLRLPTYLGAAALVCGTAAAAVRRDPKLLVRPGAFAAQALALGAIGEYLHALYRQAQGRPHYVVEEHLGTALRPLPTKERVVL
ncbi:glycosyltransferase family 2 protein [Streptomyces enissocaesilis]